ncbi:MAG: hypothetical protein MJ227_04050 [Bacilli bacterium]|nr:hypothetical protein [Bacilli bacterium]
MKLFDFFKKKNKVPKKDEIKDSPYFGLSTLSLSSFVKEISSFDDDEKHEISKLMHKIDLKAYNNKENALCFIVIGGICLTIAFLFIFLSLKKRMNKYVGLDYTSLQFFIMIALFAVAALCLTYGIIRLILALKVRHQCKKKIIALSKK